MATRETDGYDVLLWLTAFFFGWAFYFYIPVMLADASSLTVLCFRSGVFTIIMTSLIKLLKSIGWIAG